MRVEFKEPQTIAEAVELLAQYGSDAKLVAGGTAVVLMLQKKLIAPTVLISLAKLSKHTAIKNNGGELHIGALASITEAERSPKLQEFCPALAHAFRIVGNIRIRNQATVGGNMAEADYASDPPTMLAALNSRIKVFSPSGERTIPIGEFFYGFYTTALAPDEIITDVVVERVADTAKSVYLKYTSRSGEDRPCVGTAVVLDMDAEGVCRDLRVAVGAAVETPQRLNAVEAEAVGKKLTDELINGIAEEYATSLDPLEDARGSAWYRREMIRVFVRRALVEVRDGNW